MVLAGIDLCHCRAVNDNFGFECFQAGVNGLNLSEVGFREVSDLAGMKGLPIAQKRSAEHSFATGDQDSHRGAFCWASQKD